MPWTRATEALEKDIPASRDATCISVRAVRSSPFRKAARRDWPTFRMAERARLSERAVARIEMYDSMAWVRASTPVEAVTNGEHVTVKSGSSIATSGMRCGSAMSILTLVAGSEMMAKRVTSLPVPAVVFTTSSGSLDFLILLAPL